MPAIAYLECNRCRHHVSAEMLQSVCPLCEGLLLVRYDMDTLKKTARRDEVAERAVSSKVSMGMWRYAGVLPDVIPVTLAEGWTPMLRSQRYPELFLKEEGANPTGSFKARGMALAMTMAKHNSLAHLALSNAEDAVGTLAVYGAAAGIKAHIFIPKDGPLSAYLEGIVHGADVTMMDGNVADCTRMMEQTIKAQKEGGTPTNEVWFDVSIQAGSFRVEGAKTLGYEVVEQLGWTYPDAMICSTGDEEELIGIWKAFDEMETLGWVTGKRPRIFASQTKKSNLQQRMNSHNIVRQSGGTVVVLSEEESLPTMLNWAREEGIILSPEGALGATAHERLLASGELKIAERVVLFNPVAGLKYVDRVTTTLKLQRPLMLPTSARVGGIITPV